MRLNILESLARSQSALASMAEQLAARAAQTDVPGGQRTRELRALSRYQRVLAEKIMGIRLRRRREGIPAGPWISASAWGRERFSQQR